MADTATTPPASPTDTIIPAATSGHDNVGKKSPQPANKPKSNPALKLRQEYPSRKPGKLDQPKLAQSKLARPEWGGGGDPHRSPDSTTRGRGSSGPIPMGGDELKLVRQDRSGSGRASRSGGRQTQQPQAGALSCRQYHHRSNGAAQWGMARCHWHRVHGAGFCRTGETVHQMSNSKEQCRAKQTRCSKCGKGSHEQCDAQVFSCVNCNGRHPAAYKGCSEMQIC